MLLHSHRKTAPQTVLRWLHRAQHSWPQAADTRPERRVRCHNKATWTPSGSEKAAAANYRWHDAARRYIPETTRKDSLGRSRVNVSRLSANRRAQRGPLGVVTLKLPV